MSHLDEQIAEALTHGPDTLTYILAQEVTRLRQVTADLRGAINSDEDRLKAAEIRVWGESIHGCDAPDRMADLVISLRARVAELEARKSGIEWMPMDSAPTATWSKAILCDSSGFVGVGMLDGKWLWYHNDKLAFPRFWAPLPAPPDRLRANQGGDEHA